MREREREIASLLYRERAAFFGMNRSVPLLYSEEASVLFYSERGGRLLL